MAIELNTTEKNLEDIAKALAPKEKSNKELKIDLSQLAVTAINDGTNASVGWGMSSNASLDSGLDFSQIKNVPANNNVFSNLLKGLDTFVAPSNTSVGASYMSNRANKKEGNNTFNASYNMNNAAKKIKDTYSANTNDNVSVSDSYQTSSVADSYSMNENSIDDTYARSSIEDVSDSYSQQ